MEPVYERSTSTIPGDVPCADCGTEHNIVWFTDNVFWNEVCTEDNPILCVMCFVKRVEAKGYSPNAWRVLPSWEWTTQEHIERQRLEAEAAVLRRALEQYATLKQGRLGAWGYEYDMRPALNALNSTTVGKTNKAIDKHC